MEPTRKARKERITGRIGGQKVVFTSHEEKFNALAAEWRRLRDEGSSTAPLVNDAYGQIVAMGWEAVPFLLREVEQKSGHWFTALKWITGEDVVKPEMRGNIRAIREAWLQWGIAARHLGQLLHPSP